MAQSIIVAGGGAAGLMAAKILTAHGHKVTILEANTRLGGRMHTIIGDFRTPVEAGAEFIHGDVPETFALLKEAGIGYTRTGGKMYRSNNGRWVEEEEEVDGWDKLTQKMDELETDTTLQNFLEEYFPGDAYLRLRNQVRAFAEGFDVADPAKVSVFMLRDEWEHEGPQYRIDGGYGQLINYLAEVCRKNDCVIKTNCIVKQINWRAGHVTVLAGGREYIADKVIITVPVAMLKAADSPNGINFMPLLPAYTGAANGIGYGDVVKVILEFNTRFWEKHKKNAGFILSSEWMPVWWTQFPGGDNTLTGWLGGPKATALRDTPDEVILQHSLQSLCSIFGVQLSEMEKELVAAKVFNWGNNPYSVGAYSYATPATKKALAVLATPVENTLFFAGEAIYDGPHPGTVEAALVSGRLAAEKILALAL
ncbi:MAG TPA: NAD(P)/FAD-dependent oxidoreductase [Chitinophagaceae bacterium]|nr:NAD(P)/FAD-dependent oxidoreductase [Chitinophagaceae bacterium]